MTEELTGKNKNSPYLGIAIDWPEISLKGREKQVIGEMLVEFMEAEKFLDSCLAAWFYPMRVERFNLMIDALIIYAPMSRKIDCAEKNKILPGKVIRKLRKVNQKRNDLAHRRPDGERIGRVITDDAKNQFIKDCVYVKEAIHEEMKEEVKRLRDHLEKDYLEIRALAVKAAVEKLRAYK